MVNNKKKISTSTATKKMWIYHNGKVYDTHCTFCDVELEIKEILQYTHISYRKSNNAVTHFEPICVRCDIYNDMILHYYKRHY